MVRNPLAFHGLVALALLGLPAARATADPAAQPDPPGTSAILGQLRLLFKAWDLDHDGYLDKEELAKAFRGSNARPYDLKAPGKDDNADKGSGKTAAKPDPSQYPDYVFLTELDKDGDGKISRDEFESWARDYALQLKQVAESEARILEHEARMARGLSAKETRLVQSDLKKEQELLKKIEKQEKSFEKALQKALKGTKR
jgi:EF hand domain-containing protein